MASQEAQTAEDGTARVTFNSAAEGSFLIKAVAKTVEDREITQTAWLWIPGSDFNAEWWGEGRHQIRLIADKKSYKVGDTAHVMIVTGVADSHVLVTTEGRSVHTRKVVHAKSQTITIDIPLHANDQPNIFIAAAFLKDNKLYESTHNLKVPAIQTRLHIEIQRTKDQFEPGQKAGYTIIARDAHNKPVAAEFSIGIVDEAIYAIAPEASGDIHDFFYATVYDRVSTECLAQLLLQWRGRQKADVSSVAIEDSHGARAAQALRRACRAESSQRFSGYGALARRRAHRRPRPRARRAEFPRFTHHVARHGARRHQRHKSRQRHRSRHRAQKSDGAPRRPAILPPGR